jgi:hypothetical protein
MWTNFGNGYHRWPIENPSIGIQTDPNQFCHFRTLLVYNYIILTPRKGFRSNGIPKQLEADLGSIWIVAENRESSEEGCHAKTAFLLQ